MISIIIQQIIKCEIVFVIIDFIDCGIKVFFLFYLTEYHYYHITSYGILNLAEIMLILAKIKLRQIKIFFNWTYVQYIVGKKKLKD